MNKILDILKQTTALLDDGHYLLSSGRSSRQYIQCAKLQEFPKLLRQISKLLAEKIETQNLKIDCVASPAIGAIIPGYQLCVDLNCEHNIFMERNKEGQFELRRSYNIKPGWNYLIMEDVVTTGNSFRAVGEIIRAGGGNVIAVACYVDRTNGAYKDFGINFIPLISLDIPSYGVDDLPEDLKHIKPYKPGSNNNLENKK